MGSKWKWSEEAQAYYWCHWEQDGYAEPQYNWENVYWQEYAKKILHHWLTTGIDGVILDAVNWYLNCNWHIIKTCAVDIIHSYPNTICIPEGSTGFGDDFLPWITEGGFDGIENQTFHSDLHWNGSAIMEAIHFGNPQILEQRLNVCDEVRRQGKFVWSYLSWGKEWDVSKRLLEIAILVGTGHMTEIIKPEYIDEFSQRDIKKLQTILQAGHENGLALTESRERVKTSNDTKCYACIRSKNKFPVLCVFNMQSETIQVDINIEGKLWKVMLEGYDFRYIKINKL